MRTLIVEDDVTSRKLMESLLAKYGECDSVEDGIEAIVAHRMAICEDNPYDLICLDLNLPDVDGLMVLRKIRWYEETKCPGELERTKIFVTTSSADRNIVKKAISLGCDNYILKPLNRDKLTELMLSFGFDKEE